MKNPGDYIKWINDPGNGLIRERIIHGVKLTVRYLPAEFQAFNELKNTSNASKKMKDSLVAYYSQSKTFLLTIGSEIGKDDPSGDIMFRNISKYDQYKDRSMAMNFEMDEFVSLVTPEATYAPVLSSMENVYGLSNARNINFVFADKDKNSSLDKAKELDFIFDDGLFDTGRSHFAFDKKNLDNIPHLIF